MRLQSVLAFALFPVMVTIGGAIFAVFRRPSARASSYLQHLAAGVVFAAAAGEVLPQLMHHRSLTAVALGFTLGIALMLLIRSFAPKEESLEAGATESRGRGIGSLLGAVSVDVAVDGLLIGIGFAAQEKAGLLLTGALTLELLFLGLSLSAALTQAGKSRRTSIGLVAGISMLLPMGALLGAGLLSGLSDFPMTVVLAFAVASLLYLVTEELLVEAHEVPETPGSTAMFFAGFLALILVEMSAQ